MGIDTKLAFRPPTLREQIVNEIQQLIFDGELEPGDHLREQELTDRLGVSRTPLREAFILLERDGLVTSYPNRGIFIRLFDEQDINEIFTLRASLENLAAELIIDKLDDRHYVELEHLIHQQQLAIDHDERHRYGPLDRAFHFYFVSKSGNTRLMAFWQSIAVQYSAVVSYRARAYPDYDDHQMLIDHGAILEAYKSRDLSLVHATNEEIIARVRDQSIKGFQIQQEQEAQQKP